MAIVWWAISFCAPLFAPVAAPLQWTTGPMADKDCAAVSIDALHSGDDMLERASSCTVADAAVPFANPIPSAREFVEGMGHRNDNPENEDVLFDVPRAIATCKMHYMRKVQKMMVENANSQPAWKFVENWPDLTAASGAIEPLTHTNWLRIKETMHVKNHSDYLKHILTKREGEAKFVSDPEWMPFPDGVDFDPGNARFWDYQFVTTLEVRNWLYHRSMEDCAKDDLDQRDIRWILEKEGGQTKLLKFHPASGGFDASWSIKTGHYVTLAELFFFAGNFCSCCDIYSKYVSLPIFIHKRIHSLSNSAEAQRVRNAKLLKRNETGRWGLNSSW